MSNEIKEILEDLKNKDCYVNNETILTFDEADLLLDCITNLQKEVRTNNDLIPYFKNKVKELKKEITNLKQQLENKNNEIDVLKDQVKWWKQQCDDLEMQIGENDG